MTIGNNPSTRTPKAGVKNRADSFKASSLGDIVALQGETVAQGYWKPYTAQRPHRLYSVSKSVVSLAVGILAQENKLNLDHRIMDYFPEDVQEHTPELLRQVTLRHMLCMATCYDRAQYTPLDAQDWTRPFFEGVPVHVPGTVFSYDTSATQVLCALVEKLTGQEILAFMEERLFRHIGMTGEKRWLKDGVGVSQGGDGADNDLARPVQIGAVLHGGWTGNCQRGVSACGCVLADGYF